MNDLELPSITPSVTPTIEEFINTATNSQHVSWQLGIFIAFMIIACLVAGFWFADSD